MPRPAPAPTSHSLLAWAFVVLLLACDAAAAGPKRILILHSFGRDFAPYDAIVSTFRTVVAQRSPEPLTFIEANLDLGRGYSEKEQQSLVEYLNVRLADAPPDVVLTIGPPAARFYQGHRTMLFPGVPMVMGALDERLARQIGFAPNDLVVGGKVDLPRLVENILQVLPDTETLAVVVGSSELERFWLGELQRELAPFTPRIRIEWLNGLSLPQIRERVAALPPRSAVLYGLMIVDGAGVPHERTEALASLRAVSSAPIFGIYEDEIGKGVVGGPYTSQRRGGEALANAVLRALGAAAVARPQVDVAAFEPPAYDWRELERWNIDQRRLPPGSEIRFRPATLWEQHRVAVVVALALLLLQAGLISALLVQRAHRRRAETEAEGLAGRLVTAHEDERRRLARELHDDVTQRLAGLAIEAADLENRTRSTASGASAHSIREGLVELGEDVHSLSYRLHPSVIEDLGLAEALRIECDRIAQQGSLRVKLECQGVPRKLPAEAALCLFRVAQEALRNAERHAGAKAVDVSVERKEGGLALAVRDDGTGFDAANPQKRSSLGLASMRERVRLLNGRLDIESRRGSGTALVAWIPVAGAT